MKLIERIFKIEKIVNSRMREMINKSTMFSNLRNQGRGEWSYVNEKKEFSEYVKAYQNELYVYGCVYLIANTIASLPMRIYKDAKDSKTGKTSKQDITESHPANEILLKPNFKDSFYDILEQIASDMELTGNCYLLHDGENGKPTSIFALKSNLVKINPAAVKNTFGDLKTISSLADMIESYSYGDKPYSIDQVIHELKYNPTSIYCGMSPIQAGALTIDTTIEAKNRNYNIFKNGVSSDGSFETEQPFNENLYKRLKEDISQKYQGNANSHNPMFLFNGLKYKEYGLNQQDMEFINGLKMSREEICGFLYQVPIILLGVLENSSYNNIAQAKQYFYEFSIKPRMVKIQELFQKFIDLYKVPGSYIEFDLSNVDALKESITDKLKNVQAMFQMGTPLNVAYEYFGIPLKVQGGDTGYLTFSLSPVGTTPNPQEPGPGSENEAKNTGKRVNKSLTKFTPDMKDRKWKAFAETTIKLENKYKAKLIPYFKAQEAEVIANLNKQKSISLEKVDANCYMFFSMATGQKKAINIESILFDDGEQVAKLQEISIPVHAEAMKAQGNAELELLDIGISFDISNPRAVAYLKTNGLKKAILVTGTVKDKIREQLTIGIKEGESIANLIKRIDENVYAGYSNLTDYELERIARTEVIGASNEGSLEAFKQSGVVSKKGWLAAIDDRTRESHIEADKRYADGIPIDDDFEVGGDSGPCPGQMGSPENDINCRCTLYPITED